MTQNTPVIVDIVRSPIGRGKAGKGALSGVHPVDLLSQVIKGLVERNQLDPGLVEDVIMGCVSQAAEQSVTPARSAWLAAGYPHHVPGTTIDRRCGSAQQSIHFAAQAIAAGAHDIVIAGGIESMSRVPMGSARMGADVFGEGIAKRYPEGLVGQGVAADLVASKWGISRTEMDELAVRSHQLAAAAQAKGDYDHEIVPIETPNGPFRMDEVIRPGTTVEGLAELQPVFGSDEMRARFPDVDWAVTAGNSSQIVDGAAAALIMSEAMANKLGLRPRARFVSYSVVGDDMLLMLTAPIPATRIALKKAGLNVDDIDHFEVNEAFASVPLAWRREIGAPLAKLNPAGGAIATGHPLGASGAKLMATMLNAMERTGARYGLQTMCEASGMANATIIERI